jgi:putative transposase
MALRRGAHHVYDCWYHLVWTPKRRRPVLIGRVASRLNEMFIEMGQEYDITVEQAHIGEDHVHLYVSFPPRLSISRVVNILKSLTAIQVFREFPELRFRMRDNKLWEEGYFARTVGSGVDDSVVRRYIARHEEESDFIEI